MPDYARPRLWAPPGVGHEARQDEAELMAQITDVEYVKAKYEPDLKAIDPSLCLVKAKPHTEVGSSLKAGYWHIIRHEPGFVSYVTPLEWANGEYREPGSWIYEHIAKEDMWNDRTKKMTKERNRKIHNARERELDREALDRAGDFDERYKNANSTQVLLP